MLLVSIHAAHYNCHATKPTRDTGPCYLYSKCHQICNPGEQATHQHSNEHSRKDTPGCHNTLHHTFTVQQPELPADCTPHLLHPCKPQGYPILHERSCHNTMDYVDAATTGILSPHALPVDDLREMLFNIEETLPSTTHLPISSEDALHAYRYLCTHVLIADEQFLLLTDVPIQDHAQQLQIYEVFNLAIPHGNLSAHYNINNRYLGIKHDETNIVEISEDQFKTCQKANGQFCSLNTPFLPLANPPMCISHFIHKGQR